MNREPVEAEGLVEPESVNAGSARSTAESAEGDAQARRTADLTRGGHPERAGDQWPPEPEANLVVPPWSAPGLGEPSLEQSVEEGRVHCR